MGTCHCSLSCSPNSAGIAPALGPDLAMNAEERATQFRRKQENYMLVVYTAIEKLKKREWLRQVKLELSIYLPFTVLFCLFVTYCTNTKTAEMAGMETSIKTVLFENSFIGADGQLPLI